MAVRTPCISQNAATAGDATLGRIDELQASGQLDRLV
jgi:hypothetical protein